MKYHFLTMSKLFVVSLCCIILFTGCVVNNEAKTYVLPNPYIGTEFLVEENKNSNRCEDIYVNEDGSLTLVLTESQRKKWSSDKFIKTILPMMDQMGIALDFSDDYKELSLTAPNDILSASAPMLSTFVWYAELYQILNGTEEWSITVTLIDSDSNTVIKELHLPGEELDWSFLESVEP